MTFNPHQGVDLIPTQGGYQQKRTGEFLKETETQYKILVNRGGNLNKVIVYFYKDTGLPVRKRDREFPCYKLVIPNGAAVTK